jgi:Fructose-1,6-bisphosphatase/sedoheptulose 1,7-bisphosphatase and related proteins
LLTANIATALSTGALLGTATQSTLKSTKSRMDTSAANVFAAVMKNAETLNYIATSEAKDERGYFVEDPLKAIDKLNIGGLGIAVDVVDGTTLAANGLDGSYSLSAAASGLTAFPDMQAYAVGAPKEVLAKFNFSNAPEEEIFSFIDHLSRFYKKPANEIRAVTHSSDTGLHHSTLIEKLKSKGVQVIVPEPVIVEPPYTLGMSLRTKNAPDCIIGVFGLPEIVINTLLLGIINKGYDLQFRIASNAMLENPNEVSLKNAFSFPRHEIEKLDLLNLKRDAVYTKETIASSLANACFSATALTDDPILGLQGYKKSGAIIKLETLFSGYNGFTIILKTFHECRNSINYAACFPQTIDDLSIVIPLQTYTVVQHVEDLMADLRKSGIDSKIGFYTCFGFTCDLI